MILSTLALFFSLFSFSNCQGEVQLGRDSPGANLIRSLSTQK